MGINSTSLQRMVKELDLSKAFKYLHELLDSKFPLCILYVLLMLIQKEGKNKWLEQQQFRQELTP